MNGQSKITLSDGTEIENGRAGYADGFLWIKCTGMTMRNAALLFTDAENTATIVFQYGVETETFEGFTTCRVISQDTESFVSVCLERGK